jgi:hypothetical protein
MGFAPNAGDLRPYSFTAPSIETSSELAIIGDGLPHVKQMARDFWERVTHDERISPDFRSFLAQGNPIDLIPQVKQQPRA